MTPLDYAKLCREQFVGVEFGDDPGQIKLRGRGHVERVKVNRINPFFRLLPFDKLIIDQQGGVEFITSKRIMDLYLEELLAAGIDPANESRVTGPIVDRRGWLLARATVRLTGKPLDLQNVPILAQQVRKRIKARRERLEHLADRDLSTHVLNAAL